MKKVLLASIIGMILFSGLQFPLNANASSIDVERAEKLSQTGNYWGLLSYTSEILQENPHDIDALYYEGIGNWGGWPVRILY